MTICEGPEPQGLDPRGFFTVKANNDKYRHMVTVYVKKRRKTIIDKSGHIETNPDEQRQIRASKVFGCVFLARQVFTCFNKSFNVFTKVFKKVFKLRKT